MHSNGTLPLDTPLDAPLAAGCGYTLKCGQFGNFRKLYLPSSKAVLERLSLCNGNGQKQASIVNKGHFCAI